MSDEPTIFGRILDGELPCHRVYEDEHVLAFLDINPVSRGHTLVISKQRVPSLQDLDDDTAAAIGRVIPRLCRAIARVTGTDDLNVLVNNGARAGQEVMHVHVHLIPRTEEHGLQHHFKPGTLEAAEGPRIASEIAEMLDVP
jgi:histidine triad (HIT) family protein